MKILILYSPGLSNDYVVSKIIEKQANVYTIAEVQTILAVLKRTLKRKNDSHFSKLNKVIFYIYYALFLKRRVHKFLKEKLGLFTSSPQITTKNINHNENLNFAKELKPGIIFICGTTILKQAWLAMDIPIINVHTGIIPRYRGRFCWFWPIVENQPDLLGVSCHQVQSKVDSGKIVIQEYLNSTDYTPKLTIADILYGIAQLTYISLDKCLTNFSQNDSLNLSSNSNIKHKAYLEPGISDYCKFVFNCFRANFQKSS